MTGLAGGGADKLGGGLSRKHALRSGENPRGEDPREGARHEAAHNRFYPFRRKRSVGGLVEPAVQLEPLLQPVHEMVGAAALLDEAVLAGLKDVQFGGNV